ncbi:MAG: exopolysaccharide transport family protein [Azospirillaceae bacterium]
MTAGLPDADRVIHGEAPGDARRGLDLDGAVGLLWRFRWLLLACVVVFGAAGYGAARLATPIFSAGGTLLLTYAGAEMGEDRVASGPREVDDAVMRSEVELIRSREVLAGAARALWDGAGKPDTATLDARIDTIRRDLDVYSPTGSHVIHVAYDAPAPDRAARIANAVMESYIAANEAARDAQVGAATGWLRTRVAELRGDVEAADEEVRAYRERYALLETTSGSVTAQQLSEMNTELTRARGQLAEAEARRQQARDLVASGASPMTVAQSFDAPVINELRVRLAAARQRVAELSDRFGRSHPDLSAARAEVAEVSSAIRGEATNLLDSLDGEVVAARARVEAIERELDALEARATDASSAEQRLAQLEDEARTRRDVYQSFLVRLQETENLNLLNLPRARIISPAVTPEVPSAPRPTLMAALGVVMGGLTATGAAALSRRLRRTVDGLGQAAGLTGFVPLAEIPNLDAREERRLGLPALVATRPSCPAAESLRGAVVSIRLNKPEDRGVCLSVVSAWSGEGKSDVVAGLARLAAIDGLNVLVIDADIHHPAQSRRLEAVRSILPEDRHGATGIGDVGVTGIDRRVGLRLLQLWGDDGLARAPSSKAEWRDLLDRARDHYDLTIIDTPPLLQVADGLIPSSASDAVVLVAVDHRTEERDLREAAARCRAAGVASGAVLLNRGVAGGKRRGYAGYDSAVRPAPMRRDEPAVDSPRAEESPPPRATRRHPSLA